MVFNGLLHLHPPSISLSLLLVLGIASVVTAVLLALALLAFTERRSRPYLLIALAIAALFLRTVVAGLSMFAMLPSTSHHLFEHFLDVVVVVLIIVAIYYARSVERQFEPGEGP
jgi:ABC-type Fe3+ transport system permease subunit